MGTGRDGWVGDGDGQLTRWQMLHPPYILTLTLPHASPSACCLCAGDTALHIAAMHADLPTLRALLGVASETAVTDTNAPGTRTPKPGVGTANAEGLTPLAVALKYLVLRGAQPTGAGAPSPEEGVVAVLVLHAGADAGRPVPASVLPQQHTSASGGGGSASSAAAAGATGSTTPLHVAVALGNARLAGLLMGPGGASPNSPDSQGVYPLHVAAHRGAPDLAQVLVAAGADVGAAEPLTGNTSLHIAVAKSDLPLLAALLPQQAQAGGKEGQQGSGSGGSSGGAASAAASSPSPALRLCAAARNAQGLTPLDLALAVLAKSNQAGAPTPGPAERAVAMLLLQGGADPNAVLPDAAEVPPTLRRLPLLHAAIALHSLRLVQLLLSPLPSPAQGSSGAVSRANPNTVDAQGCSALHAAARAGFVQAVQVLVGGGADLGATSPQTGNTVLHEAAAAASLDVVMALINAGKARQAGVELPVAAAHPPGGPGGGDGSSSGGGAQEPAGVTAVVTAGVTAGHGLRYSGIEAVNGEGMRALDLALAALCKAMPQPCSPSTFGSPAKSAGSVPAPGANKPSQVPVQEQVVAALVLHGGASAAHTLPPAFTPALLQAAAATMGSGGGALIAAGGHTPSHVALHLRNPRLLKLFLGQGGASPDAKDGAGVPLLVLAARMGEAEAVTALVEAGADTAAVDPTTGERS